MNFSYSFISWLTGGYLDVEPQLFEVVVDLADVARGLVYLLSQRDFLLVELQVVFFELAELPGLLLHEGAQEHLALLRELDLPLELLFLQHDVVLELVYALRLHAERQLGQEYLFLHFSRDTGLPMKSRIGIFLGFFIGCRARLSPASLVLTGSATEAATSLSRPLILPYLWKFLLS
jgi:hypothetical protein